MSKREELLNELHEQLTLVPTEKLSLVNEAALLLSDILPPWLEKAAYEAPVEKLLKESVNAELTGSIAQRILKRRVMVYKRVGFTPLSN